MLLMSIISNYPRMDDKHSRMGTFMYITVDLNIDSADIKMILWRVPFNAFPDTQYLPTFAINMFNTCR